MRDDDRPQWRLGEDLDNENVVAELCKAGDDNRTRLWLGNRMFFFLRAQFSHGNDTQLDLSIQSYSRLEQGHSTDPGVFLLEKWWEFGHTEKLILTHGDERIAPELWPTVPELSQLFIEGFLDRARGLILTLSAEE